MLITVLLRSSAAAPKNSARALQDVCGAVVNRPHLRLPDQRVGPDDGGQAVIDPTLLHRLQRINTTVHPQ